MTIELPNRYKVQYILSIASFVVGVVLACVCLFCIPPLGEITTSALSAVSEFLILCGALLGISLSFDVKLKKFESKIIDEQKQ